MTAVTRIIGGSAGGRRLRTPTRRRHPPHQRPGARGALQRASSRGPAALQGLRFLDLYAGSGAVGLEAWSRGAAAVTLVESDRRTAALCAPTPATSAPTSTSSRGTVAAFLRRPSPATTTPTTSCSATRRTRWAPTRVAADLAALVPWLGADALVVVERSARSPEPVWPDGLERDRTKRYGETVLWYGHAGHEQRCAAVCPGSFDPVTHGHLDIIGRAAAAVRRGRRRGRRQPVQEPAVLARGAARRCSSETLADLANVRVEGFTGPRHRLLLAVGARAIVKGLRASSDFDYELPMAHMNSALTGVETVFLPASTGQSFVSLEPGQGGRGPRRRRHRVPAAVRARAAHSPGWPSAPDRPA